MHRRLNLSSEFFSSENITSDDHLVPGEKERRGDLRNGFVSEVSYFLKADMVLTFKVQIWREGGTLVAGRKSDKV